MGTSKPMAVGAAIHHGLCHLRITIVYSFQQGCYRSGNKYFINAVAVSLYSYGKIMLQILSNLVAGPFFGKSSLLVSSFLDCCNIWFTSQTGEAFAYSSVFKIPCHMIVNFFLKGISWLTSTTQGHTWITTCTTESTEAWMSPSFFHWGCGHMAGK